jgi:hypothetical protein
VRRSDLRLDFLDLAERLFAAKRAIVSTLAKPYGSSALNLSNNDNDIRIQIEIEDTKTI